MNSNPVLSLAGRLLLATLFIVAGLWKVTHFAGSAAYLGKVGLPAAEAMTVLAIIIELGGGLLVAIGWKTRWAAWGLAIFTVAATALGHRFWEADPTQYFNQLNHFLKNLAIIGGFITLAIAGPGSMSVDKS